MVSPQECLRPSPAKSRFTSTGFMPCLQFMEESSAWDSTAMDRAEHATWTRIYKWFFLWETQCVEILEFPYGCSFTFSSFSTRNFVGVPPSQISLRVGPILSIFSHLERPINHLRRIFRNRPSENFNPCRIQ